MHVPLHTHCLWEQNSCLRTEKANQQISDIIDVQLKFLAAAFIKDESYRNKRTTVDFSAFTWLPSLCSTVPLTGKTTKYLQVATFSSSDQFLPVRETEVQELISSTRFPGFVWWSIIKLPGWLNCWILSFPQPNCCALCSPLMPMGFPVHLLWTSGFCYSKTHRGVSHYI